MSVYIERSCNLEADIHVTTPRKWKKTLTMMAKLVTIFSSNNLLSFFFHVFLPFEWQFGSTVAFCSFSSFLVFCDISCVAFSVNNNQFVHTRSCFHFLYSMLYFTIYKLRIYVYQKIFNNFIFNIIYLYWCQKIIYIFVMNLNNRI